ncbi:uncharacterized protein LTR77_005056 [Saxophila tyrrhenica]|uniref:Cercosporin MFS transporter CTB4 n=1 Tax=Saxophila tyrrhenica TaxID=1690608 RepID=A0AAV9PF75_9PEZI|nr:hypothetical protein LTR77_005056 [Saxophila tyrrhenica]
MSSKPASTSEKCSSIDMPASEDPEKATADPARTQLEQTVDEDANVISWDGPDDAANPLNWSLAKKSVNIAILSAMTFLTPLASSMFAPGVPEVMREFGSESSWFTLLTSPKIIAPLSELYGRIPVYHLCNAGYICFTIGCALATNLPMLIGLRFLQGCWSIAPLTIGPGTIADLVTTERRGTAMSLWSLGPLLGPTVGPIAGGFLSAAAGWRWIFWLLAIATGVTSLTALIFMRESYATVLLERKAQRLRKETGNTDLRSKLDMGLNPKQLFLRAIVRPSKLLLLSPICGIMSLYIAIVYGTLYVLFTTFTYVFEENYGFSQSTVGLVYLGIGVGMMFGLGFLIATSDRILKKLAAKNNGQYKPEYRLPPLLYSGWVLPVGLFIYGWTVQYKIQWAVPLVGTAFFGAGQVLNFMVINTYLVDTFTRYAASAVAASTVLRAILGAVLPLVGLPMYDRLGYGWGNTLLGFVALALYPTAFVLYFYGEKIRTHPKLQMQL